MSKDTYTPASIPGCLILIPLFLCVYAVRAWAIVTLWVWFLSVLIGLFTYTHPNKSDESYPAWVVSTTSIIVAVMSVGIGWCIRWWFE